MYTCDGIGGRCCNPELLLFARPKRGSQAPLPCSPLQLVSLVVPFNTTYGHFSVHGSNSATAKLSAARFVIGLVHTETFSGVFVSSTELVVVDSLENSKQHKNAGKPFGVYGATVSLVVFRWVGRGSKHYIVLLVCMHGRQIIITGDRTIDVGGISFQFFSAA